MMTMGHSLTESQSTGIETSTAEDPPISNPSNNTHADISLSQLSTRPVPRHLFFFDLGGGGKALAHRQQLSYAAIAKQLLPLSHARSLAKTQKEKEE
jgi:hypothetical protein